MNSGLNEENLFKLARQTARLDSNAIRHFHNAVLLQSQMTVVSFPKQD